MCDVLEPRLAVAAWKSVLTSTPCGRTERARGRGQSSGCHAAPGERGPLRAWGPSLRLPLTSLVSILRMLSGKKHIDNNGKPILPKIPLHIQVKTSQHLPHLFGGIEQEELILKLSGKIKQSLIKRTFQ